MLTTQASNQERRIRESDIDGEFCGLTSDKLNCPYREVVGSLLYLAGATRPDISYTVNILSRHQVSPTDEDWKMVKRVFKYLKGTTNLGLRYTGETDRIES